MKNLILIKVPKDSDNYRINNIGCLRYDQMEGKLSSCVEPRDSNIYLESGKHKIIGQSEVGDEKFVVIEPKVKK